MAKSPSDGPAVEAPTSMDSNPAEGGAQPARVSGAAAVRAAAESVTGGNAGSGVDAVTGLVRGAVHLVVMEGGACRTLDGEDAVTELRSVAARPAAQYWIDLTSPGVERIAEVAQILGLHPLLAEDLQERDQRAKIDKVGGLVHLVLFSLGFDDGTTYEREIDMVLGKRMLLTSHSTWWDPFATRHVRAGVEEVAAQGPAYVLWALADDIIDNYFPILDRLGDEIDDLEDKVVASADRTILERLFELKRELITIRRVTSPEREMFNVLSSREESAVSEEMRLYFRDAYDHLIRLTDELDTYRELASAALEAYLSTVNNNLSLIMKRLTGVTVVVAGVGALAGIFGMSEAQTAFRFDEGPGFWIVTFGCVVLAGLAAWVLHRIDWI